MIFEALSVAQEALLLTLDFAVLLIGIIVIVGIIVILIFKGTYKVVPPHEAHVRVSRGKGRKLYCSREGFASSYYYLPLIMKRTVLPLRNKQLYIDDIPLRDSKLAKFVCDVACWVNIEDPVKAAERIGGQERITDFKGIEDDIMNLVKSVTRNSSMKMDLVTIMSERLIFSEEVEKEIQESIDEWGMKVVDLECIHFRDTETYKVIENLEARQAKVIESTTRQEIAAREKDAAIAESNAQRETKETQARNLREYREQEIEAEEKIGMREQAKVMEIQKTTQKANEQEVEALRTLEVGKADVEKERKVTEAEGTAEKVRREGKAEADVTFMTGDAEARVIEAKMTAEATGIDKKAEAQKGYQTEAAMKIEMFSKIVDGYVDIQKSMYKEFGPALQKADIRVLSTGEAGTFLGMPVSAKGGIALGGMLEGVKESTGIDFGAMFKEGVETVVETGKKLLTGEETEKTETEAEATEETEAEVEATEETEKKKTGRTQKDK